MRPDDDPGWPVRRLLKTSVIPWYGLLATRRLQESDGLVRLRYLFMAFVQAIVLMGFVTWVLYPTMYEKASSLRPAAGLILAGLVAAVLGSRFERALDCTDDASLASSYGTRFFLRIAFSEVAALLGFIGVFVTGRWWTYPAGALISLAGFSRAAPTRGKLVRDQERLQFEGCGRSLVNALRTAPGRRPPAPTA